MRGVKFNTIFTADNLYVLHGMDSASIDLVYADPPFNSKRIYSAPIGSKAAGASFKDMWSWDDIDTTYLTYLADMPDMVQFVQSVSILHSKSMASYLIYMAQRIFEIHRVLKETGSFYLHCDSTACHYLKVICDMIFGQQNFRNEIVWIYGATARGAKAVAQKLPANHDIILVYSKGAQYIHNRIEIPILHDRNNLPPHIRIDADGRAFKTSPRGDYTDASIKKLAAEGRIHKTKNGNIRIKYFLEIDANVVKENKFIGDSWTDIPDMMHTSRHERTGYPTQKPLALLRRIIAMGSNAGDVVFDPFCGCATAMVAAQQLGRKWIGIDISPKAAELVGSRLSDDNVIFDKFIHRKDIPMRSDTEKVEDTPNLRQRLYKEQGGLCNGCELEQPLYNFELDHIIPQSKGGGDYYENYQLLCGNCNRVKGNRPMEYLLDKINKRAKTMKYQITFGMDEI